MSQASKNGGGNNDDKNNIDVINVNVINYKNDKRCCFINRSVSVFFAAGGNVEFFWDDPRKVGSRVTDTDGSTFYRGSGYGTSSFITHERLKSRRFIKGDDVIFLLSLEGL